MIQTDINALAFIEACCSKLGYVLREFRSPITDSYGLPLCESTYRVVDKSTGKIKTYGTLSTVKAYFEAHVINKY